MVEKREKTVAFRVKESEYKLLLIMADKVGVRVSELLRLLIKEYDKKRI